MLLDRIEDLGNKRENHGGNEIANKRPQSMERMGCAKI